ELVARVGRVDPIPDPVIGGGAPAGIVEDFLVAHQRRALLRDQPRHDLLPLLHAGLPFLDAVLPGAARQRERLTEHESEFRVALLRICEQPVVDLLELVEGKIAAGVVEPDEDAEERGSTLSGNLPYWPRFSRAGLADSIACPTIRYGSSLIRTRRNSNLPISDCRPMVPVAGILIGLPINSPLHLQMALALTRHWMAVASISWPLSLTVFLPSL